MPHLLLNVVGPRDVTSNSITNSKTEVKSSRIVYLLMNSTIETGQGALICHVAEVVIITR